MKTEKIDLNEVKVFDLIDQPIILPITFMKDLGNATYVQFRDIERQDIGRKIFMSDKQGGDLIMNAEEVTLFIEVFNALSSLPGLLHNGIVSYLNEKLEILK